MAGSMGVIEKKTFFCNFSGSLHPFRASDVGGECPSPSYLYEYAGVDYCCCGDGCCWNECSYSTPPADCLQNVPDSQWIYSEDLGYFQAWQSKGKQVQKQFDLRLLE